MLVCSNIVEILNASGVGAFHSFYTVQMTQVNFTSAVYTLIFAYRACIILDTLTHLLC